MNTRCTCEKDILALPLFEDCEQVTTWRVLRGLLYSHSDIVFNNPIELYWIATINKYFNMGCVTFRSLCVTRTLLDIVHCLRYIWFSRRFGSWLYSRLQVIGCHDTRRFGSWLYSCQLIGCINIMTTSHHEDWSIVNSRNVENQIYLRQWTMSNIMFLLWINHCRKS
jgi:hypothetical protein